MRRDARLTLLLVGLLPAWLLGGCGGDGDDGGGGSPDPIGDEPSVATECGAWAEGSMDTDDGATRDFYNRGAALPWRNYLGDWHDTSDTPQGDAAFATATLVDDNTTGYAEWDVTTLAQAWLDGSLLHKGFFLRAIGGGGTFNFYSKEHAVASERPELVIVTADGTETLYPEADTYLPPSTYQSFGDEEQLSLTDDTPALVRFDLSGFADMTQVQSATLRLFVFEDYGGGSMDVGVFRSSQGVELPPSDPEQGLAAEYPDDEPAIVDHPDVLLFSDFESDSWGADWTNGADVETLELVSDDPGRLFEPWQGSALRVKVPGGSNTGMGLAFKFMDELGAEPEEIYFRYYLRIADDWLPSDGGKLPGISGTYGEAGWGGRPSDGTDGWSARGTFRLPVPGGNPFAGYTNIGNYVYHADMEGQYGDVHLWIDDCRGILAKNRWYAVEQYLRMNTPGLSDGVIRAWVDGRLAHEKTDWKFRTVDALKIEQIWMNVYHGGSDVPPADIHLYIDNVVIARSYIGPMHSP